MLLLDLPIEIFGLVIEVLTRNEHEHTRTPIVGPYRLVCRAFNNTVIAQFCAAAGKEKIHRWDISVESRYRLHLLGTGILYWKIVHGVHDHSRIAAIAKVIDEWPQSTEIAEELRLRFTRNVCDAVRGCILDGFTEYFAAKTESAPISVRKLLPMALAATGNVEVMTEVVTRGSTDIREVFKLRPKVLRAAVAANQTDKVDRLLYFLATNTQGPWITVDWEEMRMVALEIGRAFIVAVEMHRDKIGFMIIDFLKCHWKTFGKSIRRSFVKTIYEVCVCYGNTALFDTISYWKRTGELPDPGTDMRYKMTKRGLTYIIKRGMSCLMQHIVRSGMVDPNLIGNEAPLWLALSAQDYRMAKVLVEEGADMDRVPPGKDRTAYEYACDKASCDAQYYLILWGADTRPMREHGTPWNSADNAMKADIQGWDAEDFTSFEDYEPKLKI
ncbi:hypothetical protein E8E13_003616 [Curvularia kusanoi]|uniref:Ankyrin repeat protein n=1 Tax=Curvularia kusanoi TaxID=90978 RepID=A0A9P4T954_CURKU|nr:hypothetical protein E8E13_003616 [Curvularia kusanoi]